MTEGGAELNIHNLAYTQTRTQPVLASFWVDEGRLRKKQNKKKKTPRHLLWMPADCGVEKRKEKKKGKERTGFELSLCVGRQ